MRGAALQTLAMLGLSLLLMGGPCNPQPDVPQATVRFVPASQTVSPGSPFAVDVEIVTATGVKVQAFDFAVQGDPSVVALGSADPHPEFDDDGQLFLTPLANLATGYLGNIVDVRHGAPTQGRVATLRGFAGPTPASTTLEIVFAGVSTADGREFQLFLSNATIHVAP